MFVIMITDKFISVRGFVARFGRTIGVSRCSIDLLGGLLLAVCELELASCDA